MTTPTFAVNGTTCHGVSANWERVVRRQNADGTAEYQPYARHTWEIGQMSMVAFEALQSLIGRRLVSLATTDIDDRNSAATYTSAEMGLVSAEHTGRRATGVRVEFRVDIS